MEKVVAHRCSEMFAAKARDDGEVIEMNEYAKMVKVKYNNGAIDVYNYGEEQSIINDGICITQKIKCKFKVGDKVKRGDIICFNEEFFQEDPYSEQINWKHGVNATVALMEHATTVEDSNMVTKRLSTALGMSPTEMRAISVNKDVIIHEVVKEGSKVENTDVLMRFEDSEFEGMGTLNIKDDFALDLLSKLNQSAPKAKYSGTVVYIEALYSCSLNDMHPSLAKLVRQCAKFKNERNKFTSGTVKEDKFVQSQPLPANTKFKGVLLDKNTVVFIFYIKQFMPFGAGDKCVFGNQMKSVSCKVTESTLETRSGIKLDAIFSPTSLSKRIVNSPLIVGTGNRILEKVEQDVLSIYFDE